MDSFFKALWCVGLASTSPEATVFKIEQTRDAKHRVMSYIYVWV